MCVSFSLTRVENSYPSPWQGETKRVEARRNEARVELALPYIVCNLKCQLELSLRQGKSKREQTRSALAAESGAGAGAGAGLVSRYALVKHQY